LAIAKIKTPNHWCTSYLACGFTTAVLPAIHPSKFPVRHPYLVFQILYYTKKIGAKNEKHKKLTAESAKIAEKKKKRI
jgi:hypothetical protein